MAFERITVAGNIGSVELLKSKAGNSYVRMTVAVDRSAGASSHVIWYSVLLFGGLAKDADQLLTRYQKGRTVIVEGRPQVEAFVKKDGSPGLDNSIIAISMPELFGHRPHHQTA
jgi:single-stranded DNA-binding protein